MKRKILLTLTMLMSIHSYANVQTFYSRPVSCPLRFSQLTGLRDQIQTLVGSLGADCAKSGSGAINQLSSNVTNLEGIVSSYNTYNNGNDASTDAQYAKNVNQILGSLNTITSNTSCFYDIRSRGTLPVIADVVMSLSQFGLLVQNNTGMVVAAGGYIAGSGLKIINELVKKKFNFNKPEERRAFLQLNCAFFDNRIGMEESGIFDLETEEYRSETAQRLRAERTELLKTQRNQTNSIKSMEDGLLESLDTLSAAQGKRFNPSLARKLDLVATALNSRPNDYADKWRQVAVLSREATEIYSGLENLELNDDVAPLITILKDNLARIIPELESGKSGFTSNIDDWEMKFRGPVMAFLTPISNALKRETQILESEIVAQKSVEAASIVRFRTQIRSIQSGAWVLNTRIRSLDSKITKLEESDDTLFSSQDAGTSNEVEILDNYRKLQISILGKEGQGYLETVIRDSYQIETALDRQSGEFDRATNPTSKCAAAEKMRFAWSQYRYKIQEAHDFVATNTDLYRSSFRVGKERIRRATTYVLGQIESVEKFNSSEVPARYSVGELMGHMTIRVPLVEPRLHNSGCF